MNNRSAFVNVGKLLMKNYGIYCTPCVSHYINLMFEDIDKRLTVIDVITKA